MTNPQIPAKSIKIALIFLLVILLGSIAILGLRVLLVRLGVGEMAAQTLSGAAVCLAGGAFFWQGGLIWLGMDSPENRQIALAACLSFAGKSLVELALRLAGLGEETADILAIIIWLVTLLTAFYWIGKKHRYKDNP